MNKKLLFLVLLSVSILPIVAKAQAAASTFCATIRSVQSITYQVGGSIVIIGWVIAGILYLTAGGGERLAVAKKAMIAAVIGTVLVVIAGAAPSLIIDAFGWTGAVPMCP